MNWRWMVSQVNSYISLRACSQCRAGRGLDLLAVGPADGERNVGHRAAPGEADPAHLDGGGDLENDIEGRL